MWQSLDSISTKSPLGGGTMTGGNSPVVRSKPDTKRRFNGWGRHPALSAAITSANTHGIKAAMDVIGNVAVKQPPLSP